MRTRLRAWTERVVEGVRTPVAGWEMRAFMRGWRAPVLLFICAALQAGIGFAALQSASGAMLDPERLAEVGRRLFAVIILLEAALVIMVPVFGAGLLQREYQQRTMDDLLLTRLGGAEIAVGKLTTVVGYYAVVRLCALPVLALTFLFGGVSPWEILCAQLLLLATAACTGAVGLYCAARYRGLAITMITTILFTFGWVFLVIPLVVFMMVISGIVSVVERTVRERPSER